MRAAQVKLHASQPRATWAPDRCAAGSKPVESRGERGRGVATAWLRRPADPNDLDAYEAELLEHYLNCFVRNRAYWRGKVVTVAHYPEQRGKPFTFDHLITEDYGYGRERDLDRCRRLLWIKALIEAPADVVKTWEKVDGYDTKIGIAADDFSFVVWLREDLDRVHLLTAYPTKQRKRRRLWQEWDRSKKS